MGVQVISMKGLLLFCTLVLLGLSSAGPVDKLQKLQLKWLKQSLKKKEPVPMASMEASVDCPIGQWEEGGIPVFQVKCLLLNFRTHYMVLGTISFEATTGVYEKISYHAPLVALQTLLPGHFSLWNLYTCTYRQRGPSQ